MKSVAWLLPLICVSFAGCSREKEVYAKPLTPVRVQAIETETAEEGPKYSGSIEPVSHVDLAFRVGGYIEQIQTVPTQTGAPRLIQEGDTVEKGSKLASVREADYKAKVDQAESQLEQANAALEQTEHGIKQAEVGRDKAKLDFDRADALFKTQSLTKSDYDGAKAQLDAAQEGLSGAQAQLTLARARVAGAKALVDEANLAFRDVSLVSPIQGAVIKRLVEVGSLVGPGTPAFVLADLSTLKAVFGAPDVLLPKLQRGMALSLSTEALPGSQFTGRITSIAPAADPRSRVFDVEVTFPNPDRRLRPGMIVSIQLASTHSAAPVPVVPLTAIVRPPNGGDGYAVFVIEPQGGQTVSRARKVELGAALNDGIVVHNGLRPGDRVVVTGATLLKDGDSVQIVP